MKQYSLPYGNEHRTIEIPSTLACVTVSYEGADIDTNREAAISTIRQAMSSPIGSIPLRDMAAFSGNAVIMISDGSRLCPSDLILPAILDELNAAGVPDRAVTIMTALGMHRKHTEDELKRLTGEAVFERVRVINHSPLPEDCVSLGSTTLGTPVEVHRVVAEAALRIAVGNIEPHGLVGVSGGAKAVMPGTASRHAIESHHALTQRYPPQPGSLDHPLRKDIEEVLSFVPLHYIVNVVVNHRRNILAAFAGDPIRAHRAGADAARKIFMIGKQDKHDLVIASTGGHPKDWQLYQAVKSLQNASEICAEGGTILLLARCQEMFGNGILQHWIETIQDRERIVRMLEQQFVLGPHKVKYMDDVLQKHQVILYSDIPKPLAALAGFETADDLQETVNHQLSIRPHAKIAVMPYAGLTFPY